MDALLKLIKEYKAPVLSPLWENAPRVLDEGKWKMERTWNKFRSLYSGGLHKDVNVTSIIILIVNTLLITLYIDPGHFPKIRECPHLS